MIRKKFDCVEMKKEGASFIAQEISGLSPADELKFWKLRNQELIERKDAIKAQPVKTNRV